MKIIFFYLYYLFFKFMIYDGFHVHVRKMNIASQTLGKFFFKIIGVKLKKTTSTKFIVLTNLYG